MELASASLGVVSALATVGAKLYSLVQEIENAQTILDDLIHDVESTKLQMGTIQEYIERAELSDTQRSRCESHLRNSEVRINKLDNLLDSIVLRLRNKSSKKLQQKLKLVNGELQGLTYQIKQIDSNLSAIRQDMMLGIQLNERLERRVTNAKVVEKLEIIETNTADTDAKRLRKQYKAYAQEFMVDEFDSVLPPLYSERDIVTPIQPPADPSGLQYLEPHKSKFAIEVTPSASRPLYSKEEKMRQITYSSLEKIPQVSYPAQSDIPGFAELESRPVYPVNRHDMPVELPTPQDEWGLWPPPPVPKKPDGFARPNEYMWTDTW
ncbi:hypothetical protein ABW19_dt0207804 [Dactylella cylindrospora]|nr:hypothetical protein ABW19_dt0207804 [Dactylella cylindrospora]